MSSGSRGSSSPSTSASLACVFLLRRNCAAWTFPKWGVWVTTRMPSSTSHLSVRQQPPQLAVAANKSLWALAPLYLVSAIVNWWLHQLTMAHLSCSAIVLIHQETNAERH